jgi:hypothetical protein
MAMPAIFRFDICLSAVQFPIGPGPINYRDTPRLGVLMQKKAKTRRFACSASPPPRLQGKIPT